MVPAGAANSKKWSCEFHVSTASDSVEFSWIESARLGCVDSCFLFACFFFLNKSILLPHCPYTGPVEWKRASKTEAVAVVNALTPGTCRFWNRECEIRIQTRSPREVPSTFRLDTGQLEMENEYKYSPTHSGTVCEKEPDGRLTGLGGSCHAEFPGIPSSKYFLALAHS